MPTIHQQRVRIVFAPLGYNVELSPLSQNGRKIHPAPRRESGVIPLEPKTQAIPYKQSGHEAIQDNPA